MTRRPPAATFWLVALLFTLGLAGCGDGPASASAPVGSSSTPSPTARVDTTGVGLSAIACATDDPTGVGELTGAWAGNEGGVYYIRQVGDCVWWFGTELRDIEPGVTGQRGFANVASGRVNGSLIQVEWADLPLGNILGGGGLTLVYDEENDKLWVTQQRGDREPFGATVFTRIEPSAPAEVTSTASASP